MTAARRDPSEHLVGSLGDVVAEAVTALEAGALARSEEILRQVLNKQPRLAAAWHLRGLTAQRDDDLVRASEYFAEATTIDPENALFCRDLGIVLGLLARGAEALDVLGRALELAPEDPLARFHLANALMKADRPGEAIDHYQATLARHPDLTEAHANLSAAFRATGAFEPAIASAETALTLEDAHGAALNNLALALCDAGRHEEAVVHLESALAASPEDPQLLNNQGVALHAVGRMTEAETRLRSALEFRPAWPEALRNLGNLLRQTDRLDDAVAQYRAALDADPMEFQTYGNLGLALLNLDKPRDAVAVYEKALALRPDQSDIRMSLGIAQLALGDYAAGWRNYDARWSAASFTGTTRDRGLPRWAGEDIAGRRILVHAEQGYGDTLQFCRYLPKLAEMGATVIFECQKSLLGLCRSLGGVSEFISRGAAAPDADFEVPLLNLPGRLGTTLETIPDDTPYLRAPDEAAERWRPRLADDAFKLGIVWAGDPDRQDDVMRSCPKVDLAPILAADGIRCFSLQLGDTPDADMSAVEDLAPLLTDFAETAGAIEALDLVISVDTAVAHLAGALGKPVWVMLGQGADWRYLTDRTDSPWYPSMRLFRQTRRGDWRMLLEQVAAALDIWRRGQFDPT